MNKQAPTSNTKATPTLGYGDYLRFSRLVDEQFGLYFPENRRSLLEQGVRRAFAKSTCTDLDEYYNLLRDSDGRDIHLGQLANALTVSETHFFRNAAQFDALYQHVLPEIIERRRALRTMRIWSVGCASGEEPYSIAMLLRQLLPDIDEWSITILATDVNTEGLARARRAIYSNWAFRETRAKQWRSRFFYRQGNQYELKSEVRRMVTFKQLNLASQDYPSYESNTMFVDLILCRNVTIYFTPEMTLQVIKQLYRSMVDGGWLVIGHSEYSPKTYRLFRLRNFPNATLYQRPGWSPPELKEMVSPGLQDVQELTLPAPPIPTPTGAPPTVDVSKKPPKSPLLSKENYSKSSDAVGHARELLDYGHSQKARDLLLEVVDKQPQKAETLSLLGQAYANLGDWEQAEHCCRQAIRLDKLSLNTYYTLALVLQHQGNLEQAIEALKKVVYIDRHHVLGHYGLASLYYCDQHALQALKSLDNALRLLDQKAPDEVISGSGGVTVERLRHSIINQQQQLCHEAGSC